MKYLSSYITKLLLSLTPSFVSRGLPLALAILALASCRSINESATPYIPPVVLKELKEIVYDSSIAKLNVQGLLQTSDATELTVLTFFTSPTCSTAPIGEGISRDFSSVGIQIQVPSQGQSQIFIRTNTSSACYSLAIYDPLHLPPPPVNFTGTTPASPSRVSYTPTVYGTLSGSTAQVQFFDDSSCSHLVGSTSSADFSLNGLKLNLPKDTKSPLYSKTIEPFGNASACTYMAEYIHDSTAPSGPTLSAVSPVSPNNTSTTPKIVGKLPSGISTAVGVTLYSDSACSSEIGKGTKEEFEIGGVTITASANSSVNVYGQAINAVGGVSLCTYLTTYIHDDIIPNPPSYVVTTPASPNRLTIYPKIQGTSSSDTVTVNFFSNAGCTTAIGTGTKAQFESTGITVSTQANNQTTIYAQNNDAAGNRSNCTHLTNYINDTIAPDLPIYDATDPISPNNISSTPLVLGSTSADTVSVKIYSDEACTTVIGSGTAAEFSSPGIQITALINAPTQVYASAIDAVGNESVCNLMTNYSYSNLPAVAPAYVRTVPTSPSNTSATPYVQGTVHSSIVSVKLYSDPSCTTQIGTGSKLSFTTTGVQASVASNATTQIYAIATDIYANTSACTFMTTYSHDNIAPVSPSYLSVTPASPNNTSLSPVVLGVASADTTTVSLYDSSTCINRIGTGTQADFTGPGITVNVPPNTTTAIYARSFDWATNKSACTYMTDYTHDNIPPAAPNYVSATPRTPSYTAVTTIVGSSSPDSINISIYSDAACTTLMGVAPKAVFDSIGIQITATSNATTTLYGQSTDLVGNLSTCKHWIDYVHSDIGPNNVMASQNPNGSVGLSWDPDSNATTYIVKRSLTMGGPYTIVAGANIGNSFTDNSVQNNFTYYYVVAAANITGVSKDSSEAQITVTANPAAPPTGLIATPGNSEIQLNWTGSSSAMFYSVYRGTTTGGPYTLKASGLTAVSYKDTTVTNGVPYYYVVTSLNPTGFSVYSNEASAVSVSLPNAPTGLKLVRMPNNNDIRLFWSAPAYYKQFNVKRSTASGSTTTIATVTGTTYLDTNPRTNNNNQNNNPNFYTVSATWGSDESAKSNEVGFANFAGPTLTLSPGDGVMVLNWSNGGADDFMLERATQPGGPYTEIASGLTTTVYADTAVTNGITYYYRVSANYNNGTGIPLYSWPSTELSGTPGTIPSAPTNLIIMTSNSLPLLNWSAPTHYSGFNVYRASSLGGPYSKITSSPINTNTYNDSAPVTGMNYYRVTATWGSGETSATNIVSFRHGLTTGVTATPAATKITVSWNSTTGASNYNLKRSTTAGGPYTTVVSSTAITPFNDTTVTPGTGYFYVVSANFPDGSTGQDSAEVNGMAGSSTIPSGLTVTNTASSSVSLAWTAVTGASTYKVYRATVSGGPYTFVASPTPATKTSYTVSTLTANTNYYFVVTAVVSGTESGNSSEVAARTTSIPSAPIVSGGNNKVDLTWGFVSGASSYTLERSSDSINFSIIASGLTSTSYTDNTATNGNIYFYRYIPVFPSVPAFYSAISLSVTPGVTPLVPTGLVITGNNSGTDVDLSWGSVPGATSYNVKRSTVSGGPYTTVVSGSASTTVNIPGLTVNVPIYLVVSALNGTVESSNSTELAVVPSAPSAAPTGSAAIAGQIDLTWGAVAGAVSYNIQRSTDSIYYLDIATNVATTNYSDTTVVDGTAYLYRYQPLFTGGVPGAYSLSSIAITPGTQPLIPSSLVGDSTSATAIQLNWVQVPQATSYNIKRGTSPGGPYSKIANSASTTYTDSGLTPGFDYYYVVTAVNASDVESGNSNEVGLSTLSAPTGFVAVNGNNSNDLSWSAVGGASSYTVKRSVTTGGPYAAVATGVTATTYSDTNINDGTTYYYVVVAKAASGAVSPNSSEASIPASVRMNLQVPIELTDQSMNSDTTATTFERTRTSLDTDAYDGTVTYFIEAVAKNNDTGAHNIEVVDSNDVTVGTISIPGSTPSYTRIRAAFTPNLGSDTYRMKLNATPSFGQLVVYSARILVNQVGASKTKLYIPLLSSNSSPSSADVTAFVERTSMTTYSQLASSSIYKRDTSVLSNLNEYDAWELETLVSTSGGAVGIVSLYNQTKGLAVDDTETMFSSNSIIMTNSPFDEGVTNFGSADESNNFEVALRCDSNCSSGSASLYKAGLWVSLSNLSKLEVHYRNSPSMSSFSSQTTFDQQRTLIDLTAFTNPTVYFEANAIAPSGGTMTIDLMSTSTNDSGLAGLSAIGSSSLLFSWGIKEHAISSALTINSGDRFIIQATPDMPVGNTIDSSIVIRSVR